MGWRTGAVLRVVTTVYLVASVGCGPQPDTGPQAREVPDLRALAVTSRLGAIAWSAVPELHREVVQARRLLAERVLVPDNLETPGAEPEYRLRPEVTCRPLADDQRDGGDGPGGAGRERACVRLLAAVEVRARLETDGPGYQRVAFFVGPERVEPMTVRLTPTLTTVALPLFAARRAAGIIAAALGLPDSLPAQMRGRVEVSFFTREDVVELTVSLPVPVEIADDARAFALRSRSADPLQRVVKATFSAARQDLNGQVWLGPTEIVDGQTRLFLAGLTGVGGVTPRERRLSLSRVSLGPVPSFVEVAGERVLEVLLNEGRSDAYNFQIMLRPDASERQTLRLIPRLDLRVTRAGELLRLFVDGPPDDDRSGALLEEVAGGVRVARGSFLLSSSASSQQATAAT
jgi:hypothetical protein